MYIVFMAALWDVSTDRGADFMSFSFSQPTRRTDFEDSLLSIHSFIDLWLKINDS